MGIQYALMRRKSLSPANLFHFVCPIFNVETRFATCVSLRDLVWKGRRPEQRKGCQACMSASKCPINNIIQDFGRLPDDPYHADEKRVGSLKDRHIERIMPVLVSPKLLDEYAVTPKERELILAANEAAGAWVSGKQSKRSTRKTSVELEDVQRETAPVSRRSRKPPAESVKERAPEPADAVLAAESGDMSAAINMAMTTSAEPAASAATSTPKPKARMSLLERARAAAGRAA
ncbi:hypothetical protein SAMN05216548_114125 [Faunimonas pinastri]|uniref:Uncharacterized protein n=1 Tax=Faunimonas pinastri TaxID=1855383 RepID=A0A1H9N0P3_9HYPH|nr:hypothetical protein [Faunimonas pinastri]SER29289.1 hypothetical protein SAMN05216548_114125 [Faunimonas pinastri]